MEDTGIVDAAQPAREVQQDRRRIRERQRTAADHGGQVRTLDALHHQIAIAVAVDQRLDDPWHVVTLDLAERDDLALELEVVDVRHPRDRDIGATGEHAGAKHFLRPTDADPIDDAIPLGELVG